MDMDKILAGLVRIGKITAIDKAGLRVRAIFEDTDTPSGWLCVLQHRGAGVHVEPDGEPTHDHKGTYMAPWMPKVNEIVVVLYLPVFNGDGFVLGGI